MIDIKNIKLGALPSKYDPRDYSVKMVAAVAFPDEYIQQDIPIYNQGQIGNCVMQALRSAPHKHYGKEFGATFGYGRWRSHDGMGMYANEACNGFVTDGIPSLTDDNEWHEMPDAKIYSDGNAARLLKASVPFKGWTWARMHTIDEIKAALMQGVRCIVCLPYVGMENGRWLVDGQIQGYHEMAIVGWTPNGWEVRNSWGMGGFGRRADGYVTVAFDDIFACQDVIALFPPKDNPIIEPRRTLRLKDPRMTGADVKECQEKIVKHGFPIKPDGIFGTFTEKAVKNFQWRKNLVVDGIVGPITWAELDKDPSGKIGQFGEWLKKQVGHIYMWGGQGETATESLIKRRETSTANANRAIALYRKRKAEGMNPILAYDCSGLGMKWLLDNKVLPKDLTAAGMYSVCRKITREELKAGDMVFVYGLSGGKMKIHHVGYMVNDLDVVEAKGRDDGVVIRPLAAGKWNRYGSLNN